MKKVASLLLVAVAGGAISLGAYTLFLAPERIEIVTENQEMPVFQTSNTPVFSPVPGTEDSNFITAAEKTVNAVVHVKNVTVYRGPTSFTEYIFGYEREQKAQIGTGSGVIISPDGYIVTNNHVIARATEINVTLNNNKTYNAEVVGTDPSSDIALIKIDAEEKLPYLAFGDSDNVRVGEWVLAVGNPFNLTSTVTAGIVSAKARALGRNNQTFLQTDAAVNPGNSGGALVNTNGDLIGINTAITSQTGSYVGYSFAVPSNNAKKVVEDIMEYGNVLKGILGINSPRLDTPYARQNGFNQIDGVYVDGVEEDSGADDANIQRGDIIRKVDDIRVRRFADLVGYVSTKRPGDQVEVSIDRDGEELIIPVTLKERQRLNVPVLGLEVKNLTEEEKEKYNVEKGVKITGVPEDYREYDLQDKVIITVNGEDVGNIQDARNLFGQLSRYRKNSFTVVDKNGARERIIFQ
ncbi:trypsin-like peptidase domain-containing protein [Lentiprolixibacter aurantiacus]|uniref:Trypsin-like peptidase domain-containing protein n=1 Tax=Lentiprolixibacter aurantiacus TaxID=2993939 RepID=A0AAE3SNC4_9FLAO|nr:trypsin-like peptidase domain-containing protein [Lentiprolixibacter aurantiacus]MCX2719355.1 trypsin-like peptidase domain-containing protein [Lentiprolixibacter aurantiacus]